MKQVRFEPSFDSWRKAARSLLQSGNTPDAVLWQEANDAQAALELGGSAQSSLLLPREGSRGFRVPGAFIATAKTVALHRDRFKWALLYRVLWRLANGEPHLLANPADPDVLALDRLHGQVRRDAHRMKAFVRFRETTLDGEPWFVAWYEPEHLTLSCNEQFFKERFASLRWSILTPDACMHWNGEAIAYSPGVTRAQAPSGDDLEPLWITYYSSTFNPARVNPSAMRAQLLKRNWENLPEAAVIGSLLRSAHDRTFNMIKKGREAAQEAARLTVAVPPAGADLATLRKAAAGCTACPLYKGATCVVFGEGPPKARIVFVGEQPGDQEDRQGKPFIGPAGKLLDRALDDAGVDRKQAYVTNAVKHFKFLQRGNRRMHDTPNANEIKACRPWLAAELEQIKPCLIVALGATAARSIFNAVIRIGASRGEILDSEFGKALVTIHPSALLRMPDHSAMDREYARFVADLKLIPPLYLRTGAL